jgi:hypothetical protein
LASGGTWISIVALVTRLFPAKVALMALALVLLVLAAAWRITAVFAPALSNFCPLMALTFCGALYFRDKRLWLVPFFALTFSDFYLNHYYAVTFHESWNWSGVLVRLGCFALAVPLGRWVAARKSWLNLFSGALVGSVIFYFATNTDAWLTDPAYVKTAAGWWQALTVGRPEFPPTLFFFRNTFVSDLLFTGLFALTMEYAAKRVGQPSLLAKTAAA